MLTKLLRKGLSMILISSFLLLPMTSVSVQAATDLTRNQEESLNTTVDKLSTSETTYDEVKKVAEEKAKVLTSLYGVTSVQYALIDNGEIVLSGQEGVYSKNSNTSLTENNMYGIGSVSKMFTTAAVMQLVDKGKVNLDTPVVQYIPEFTMADPRYKDITVRMLLNHSSGLMGSTFQNAFLFDEYNTNSVKNLLNELKTQRLKADPGAYSVYCNDGFSLAEALVEKVSGLSFSEYIKNNISDPLTLNNTKTPQDYFSKDQLAKTYTKGVKKALPVDSVNAIGAGGIYSSASDLCRFAQLFMKQSTSSVLSTASANQMSYPEYLTGLWPEEGNSLFSYGLGWDSVKTYPFNEYGIKALVKGGDTLLYHSSITVLPDENMAVAVLSSGGASIYDELMAEKMLLAALKTKGRISEIKTDITYSKPVKVSMPVDLKKYEGVYASYNGVTKVDISDDGILTLSDAMQQTTRTQKFIYAGNNRFYYTDGSTYLSFVEESNGNTYIYYSSYTSCPSLAQFADSGYLAQKLTDTRISEELQTVWKSRSNKNYFIINEKYNSQLYALSSIAVNLNTPVGLAGYSMYDSIIDKNSAKTSLQIPGLGGRDIYDLNFNNINNTEYLYIKDSIAISEDAITIMPSKSEFTSKINSEGDAYWYKIGKKSVNRKITVTVPEKSSFTVYDGNNTCIINSYISKQSTVVLPANGHIVFVGEANAEFQIKYLN